MCTDVVGYEKQKKKYAAAEGKVQPIFHMEECSKRDFTSNHNCLYILQHENIYSQTY
jgi:hypothetical protein